jgi:putative flippase GtrA
MALGNLVTRARLRRNATQFIRFACVGCVGAAVDFGFLYILTEIAGFRTVWQVPGISALASHGEGGLVVANLVSVLLAMVAVFLLNKYWTFRDPRADVLARQGVGFFCLYCVTYVLNQLLTSLFLFYVLPALLGSHLTAQAGGGSNPENFNFYVLCVAKILAVGICLFVNFVGLKLLVFRTASMPAHEQVAPFGKV